VTLCDDIVVEEEVCEIVIPMTSEAAKKAYEKKFGKYCDLYFSDGAIIGLPYSFDLKELLEMTERERQCSSFRLGNFRISLIRTWLIKRHLSLTLLLCETILTWVVVAFCKLQYSFVCSTLLSIRMLMARPTSFPKAHFRFFSTTTDSSRSLEEWHFYPLISFYISGMVRTYFVAKSLSMFESNHGHRLHSIPNCYGHKFYLLVDRRDS
jgi:hypothetical protein